jgi:hypothetical protein
MRSSDGELCVAPISASPKVEIERRALVREQSDVAMTDD